MSQMSTFEGVTHVQTARAILFQSHYWEAPMWLPISQIQIERTHDEPLETVVKVKSWLCSKRGFHEFSYYTKEEIEKMGE